MRRTRIRRLPLTAAALAAACLAASALAQAPQWQPAPAQEVRPLPAGLRLAEALALVLRRNPEILVGETIVTASEGGLQTASGAFDPLVNGGATLGEDRLTDRRSNSVSLGVQQLLRNGVLVDGTVGGTGVDPLPGGVPPQSQAAAALTLTFPFLRGAGTDVTTANETIQRLALEGSRHSLQETAAQSLFDAAQAYWRLRAAGETLAILREAEERAQRQVRDTQRLIDAGEQPAANINLALATFHARRATRVDAERALSDARLQLGQVLGLDPADLPATWTAADPFPAEGGSPIDAATLQQLVAGGLQQRQNIRAAEASLQARRVAVLAAGDQLKPVLNGGFQVGAGGTSARRTPAQTLLQGRTGHPQAQATLTWQWDVVNNTAKGRYLTAAANYDQQAIVTQALRRSVASGIASAVAAYNASLAQLAESRRTVELYNRAVEGERSKLRLNSATLLDVVNLENLLQQARVTHVNTLAAHAVAIAALRFQAGQLLAGEGDTQLLTLDRLLAWRAPPAPAALPPR